LLLSFYGEAYTCLCAERDHVKWLQKEVVFDLEADQLLFSDGHVDLIEQR
jgi:hypothetical protein